MERTEKGDFFQRAPELGQIVEQEQREQHQEHDGDCPAAPVAERRNQPGEAAHGSIEAEEVGQDDEQAGQLSPLRGSQALGTEKVPDEGPREDGRAADEPDHRFREENLPTRDRQSEQHIDSAAVHLAGGNARAGNERVRPG